MRLGTHLHDQILLLLYYCIIFFINLKLFNEKNGLRINKQVWVQGIIK